jgi:hypothetical protein
MRGVRGIYKSINEAAALIGRWPEDLYSSVTTIELTHDGQDQITALSRKKVSTYSAV